MLQAVDLGMLGYREAHAIQRRAVEDVLASRDAAIIFFVEHPPVYTTGSGKVVQGLPFEVVRTGRGGDITCHAPGQLVVYPVLNLLRYRPDLHAYLRFLENVVIQTVGKWGVRAYPVAGRTGVWTERGKLASIGIAVRRWVTYHGLALNVSNDLTQFDAIDPCGIPGCPMTSLSGEVGYCPNMSEVKNVLLHVFIAGLEQFRCPDKGGSDD